MKLYTKTGDRGTTGLFGGARVDKTDERVTAYGTVDEVNAVLGLARSASPPDEVDARLVRIQHDLFVIGAELACAPGKESKLAMTLIGTSDVEWLEQAIDTFEEQLSPLKQFVLPGGHRAAAALHHARTVCRRAERCIVAAHEAASLRREVGIYLNRLSDLLFVLARRCNQSAGVDDIPWHPRQERSSP